jgi:hypothetical protein
LLFFDIVEGTGIRRVAEVFGDPEVDADQAEQVRSFSTRPDKYLSGLYDSFQSRPTRPQWA